MVTQAEKFKWLGLSSNLETVNPNNIPPDAITINSFTATKNANTVELNIQLENTITETIDRSLYITKNNQFFRVENYTFNSEETKNITLTYFTFEIGNIQFTAKIGNQTQTTNTTFL